MTYQVQLEIWAGEMAKRGDFTVTRKNFAVSPLCHKIVIKPCCHCRIFPLEKIVAEHIYQKNTIFKYLLQ